MFIHILDEVADLALESAPSPSALDAFENTLRAFREGKHVVLISPQKIDKLVKIKDLSSGARGSLQKIKSRWPEIAGLGRVLSIKMEVALDKDLHGTIRTENDASVVTIHYPWLSDSSRSQKSILLGENLSDAELYMAIGRATAAQRRWQMPLAAELQGGGGSTVGETFSSICALDKLVLCIVDSDRKIPNGAMGATAKAASTASKGCSAFQRLIVLSCRTIENLLPPSFIESSLAEVGGTDGEKYRAAYEKIKGFSETHGIEVSHHINMKLGLRFFEFSSMRPGTPEFSFWEPIVQAATKRLSTGVCNPPKCGKNEDCSCVLLGGLGKGFLDLAVKFTKNKSSHKLAEHLGNPVEGNIKHIGENVIAWCCAYKAFST